MFPSGFRSDLPPPNVWLPPRTHPVFDQLRNAFLIEPMSSSERGGRRGAEGRPRTEGIRPREDSNPGHYGSVMTIYTSVSPVHVHQSLRSCCCEGFGFGLVFVLPMKIENRLLIGRDFFADWLSSLSTFSRTEKSSLAASQPPRVSSTIKPRCDAAPVPHTPHTSTSIPAHARSSDLRQHQVSLVSINTRARFGARVAARPRDSGDRSRRCFPPQKGPVYRGSPPPRSTRLARSIVDAEGIDASIRPMTSQSTKFTGSERVYILGAVSTTALSGALVREKSSNLLG